MGALGLDLGGWRYLCPAVPAQPCGMSDTGSTVLVSGSQSAEHHRLLAKIVPILVRLCGYIYSELLFVAVQGLGFFS